MLIPREEVILPVESRGTWSGSLIHSQKVCSDLHQNEDVEIDRNDLFRYFVSRLVLTYQSRLPTSKEEESMIDFASPEMSYILGLFQADASMTRSSRNKGKIQLELSRIDRDLLITIKSLFNCNSSITDRTRNTNFKTGYKSSVLVICNKTIRDEMERAGLPYGKKSSIVGVPSCTISQVDYIRGLIDGDGSIGMTSNGFPFLSLVTDSEEIKEYFCMFLKDQTGKTKEVNRNTRDNIYNIIVYKEDAQIVASSLYYPNCISLLRKKKSSEDVLLWKRPSTMKKIDFTRKRWSSEDDKYLLSHSTEESMEFLKRTQKSVVIRRYRLNKCNE